MSISRLFSYPPLGMNLRNRLIADFNSPEALRRAKNKLEFKRLMEANELATARTYQVIHDYSDTRLLHLLPDEFVIKPTRGSGGVGILLLKREGDSFVIPSGERYSESNLKRHIRKILDGEFSTNRENDFALVEERVYPSEKLQFKNLIGLPDIRVLCFEYEPVMTMVRYPTLESAGRANLARGALGIGIDLVRGTPTYVKTKKDKREFSPAEIGIPPTFVMPKWEEIKAVAREASKLANLGISGVDLVLDSRDRVLVLEVNGRPGLEIQNINESSLLRLISRRRRSQN